MFWNVALIDEKAGWQGIRIVKAFIEKEWNTIKKIRRKYYFDKLQNTDPYTCTFNDPNHVHLVVYQKTKIIGYAHIQLCADEKAVIHFIFINENKRNQNLGSQLLSFVEQWLKSRNCKNLYCTPPSNEIMLFFKNNGFGDMVFDDGNVCNIIIQDQDALMGKVL